MDTAETSSHALLRDMRTLRRSVSQIQKDKEAFLKQLQVFPHTFHILDELSDDKKERALSGLVWAISTGYRSERTASLEEARARNMTAVLLHGLRRSEEALQELNTVLKMEGQSSNLVTLANKAVILWERHNLSQAQQQLQALKTIQDDPDSDFEYLVVRAKAELAFTYSRLGPDFHRRGLELFREVLPQAREPEIWLWKFGHALTWQRILRAHPDSSIFNPPIDMIQEQRDLLTELLEIVQTCTCINTKAKAFAELAFILNMVWKVSYTRREFEERIGGDRNHCCEQAIGLDSEDHSVLVKCGRIFRYTRRTDESRKMLEKAVSMRPSSTGYHHLGITYKALATHAIHKDRKKVPGYYRYMEAWHSPRGARNPQYKEASHSPCGARNPQYIETWHSPRVAKNPRDGSDSEDAVRQFSRMSLDDDRSTGAAGAAGYSGHTPRGRGFRGGNRSASGYRGGRNFRPHRLQMPDPRALGIDPEVMPSLSLDKDIRRMQIIIKSPPIQGVTTFSRDNEFVMEAMQCFEIAIDVSKGENTRAAYDLALLHRCLGEYEQAKIYLQKMLSHEHNFYPIDEIIVYEQLGLVIKELSKMEQDEQTKQQRINDSKQWLLMALKAASDLYAKSLQKQIGKIWQSFSSLMEEMKTCDKDEMNILKKDHVEKAEFFRLICDHEESLAVLKHFQQLSPKEKDDPEILAEYIKNFAEMKEYQQVLTYLNLLKGTEQRERVTELLGEDFSERQINIMAGKQALLSAPADDSPFAALNAFKKSFNDVYNIESMPDTTSSEGSEAAVNSNISGTSEENGRVNPEPAASTSGNIRPLRRQWDVTILHEEESTEKADSLVRVLRDLCKLRVTARHSEIKPGMLELDFHRVMEQSKVVLVLVETDDHNDEVLKRLTDIAAFYQRSHNSVAYPSTVVLFTEGAEDKIPHVLNSHRKFLCSEGLLRLGNSLNPREACTDDVADMVCQLMDFLTDTKNLK